MKKTMLVLIAVLSICLLAGCGGKAPEETSDGGASGGAVDVSSIKTLGDAFALRPDEYSEQRSIYQGKYVYAFTVDGVLYRAVAEIPSDIEKQIDALDFDDEDYDKKEKALVADLPVISAEDLTGQILPQEELDALVGKTGQELVDMGWRAGSFYNGETREAWLDYGPYAYSIHFDGEVLSPSSDDFDDLDDLLDRKVVDASFEGVGDATNVD